MVGCRSAEGTAQEQVQPLTGDDRIEVGVLAQRAPVGLAEGVAAFAARLALSALARAAAETLGGGCIGASPLLPGFACGGGEQDGLPLEGRCGPERPD
jgi:hypothetical protein